MTNDLHWTQQLDQRNAHARHEAEQARKRELEAADAQWNEAARRWGSGEFGQQYRRPWEAFAAAGGWDAPSVTEQAYQAQQAEYDRQRRWVVYAAERVGKTFNTDGTPREYDVTAPPQWFR